MSFRELIDANIKADSDRRMTIESGEKKLSEEIKSFIDSLDNDMLEAIVRYGKHTAGVRMDDDTTVNRSCHEYTHGKYRILVYDTFNPKSYIVVLAGSYGFESHIDSFGNRITTLVYCGEDFNGVVWMHKIDPSVWIDHNNNPFESCMHFADSHKNIFDGKKIMIYTQPQWYGNWFDLWSEAMPEYKSSFEKELKSRINKMKGE